MSNTRNTRETAMAMSIAETGRMNGRSRRMRARMQNHRSTNPIFGKNPERAVALARALGAVQGPTDDEGCRLRTFLELSRPPTTDVLEVYKTGTSAVWVRTAVRYRVGPICLALYVDVTRTRPGGITAVGEKDVQRLYAFIPEAALYVPPHNHAAGDRKCRCRRLRAAARTFPVPDRVGQRGMPDNGRMPEPYWYGTFIYAAVEYAVRKHCPRLVRRARRLAREAAWRAAREALR